MTDFIQILKPRPLSVVRDNSLVTLNLLYLKAPSRCKSMPRSSIVDSLLFSSAFMPFPASASCQGVGWKAETEAKGEDGCPLCLY